MTSTIIPGTEDLARFAAVLPLAALTPEPQSSIEITATRRARLNGS